MKDGWEIRRFGDVCEFEKESGEWKNLPYVGLEDIESNSGRFLGTTSPLTVKSMTFRFTSDHVLYGRLRPYLNKVLLPDFEGHCSTEIFPIRTSDELDRRYLFHWLRSDEIVAKINATWTGARMPRANMNQVLDFPIPVPPIEEQRRIVAILDEALTCIDKAKANTEKNIQNASELFDSYLNNIFSNPAPDWERTPIGEICALKSGTTIPKSLERQTGDIPYVKVGDMNLPNNESEITTSSRFVNRAEISSNQIIPEGSIIFPKRGGAIATNKKRAVTRPIIADLNTMAIIPGERLSPELFYHWFKTIDLNELSNGTSVPQINNYSFDNVFIPFPNSSDEQSRITNRLDELSEVSKDLEGFCRNKIVELDELKKSILQKAFSGKL